MSQNKHYSLCWMLNNEDRTYHGMFNNIILLRHTKGWLMRFHQISYMNCVICKPQNIVLVKGNIWQAISSLLTNSTLGNLANAIINTTYLTHLHLQFIINIFPAELHEQLIHEAFNLRVFFSKMMFESITISQNQWHQKDFSS